MYIKKSNLKKKKKRNKYKVSVLESKMFYQIMSCKFKGFTQQGCFHENPSHKLTAQPMLESQPLVKDKT